MTDNEDDDARARRERAEALRKRVAQEKAGKRSGPPSSPHEFVEDEMRTPERDDREEDS
jgi:hypothetical protein